MRMKKMRTGLAVVLATIMVLAAAVPAAGLQEQDREALFEMSAYQVKQTAEPTVSQTGGEWLIIALARSGAAVPEGYYEKYYRNVEETLRAKGGVLSSVKNTEYARVILALTAIGKDPRNVAGYDLTKPLADYEKTVRQGLNGAVFALIALNSGGYDDPAEAQYLDYILSAQNRDGGFGLAKGSDSGVDITAMAVQALAPYAGEAKTGKALKKALQFLAKEQTGEGGYADNNELNAESTAQVIIALRASEAFWDGSLFPAETEGMTDSLMGFAVPGQGFSHLREPLKTDPMATEQGLLALTAEYRSRWNMKPIYEMTGGFTPAFKDIDGDPNRGKIFSMAERGIINGKGGGIFDPAATMTRAEFAAIVVRGLGLTLRLEKTFDDVAEGDWFYGYAAAAYRAGIVKGVSATRFDPQGTITRQEALTMVARAALQAKAVSPITDQEAEAALAAVPDGTQVSDWARNATALCLKTGLTEAKADGTIVPAEKVCRSEIAGIIYNLYFRL